MASLLPAEAQETLLSSIRERIMGMIPEDKLKVMIDDEINAFFGRTEELNTKDFKDFKDSNGEDAPEGVKLTQKAGSETFVLYQKVNGYGSSDTIATNSYPFRILVWNELKKAIQPALSELTQEKVQAALVSELKAKKYEIDPANLSTVMHSVMESAMSNLAYQLVAPAVQQYSFEKSQELTNQIINNINMSLNTNIDPNNIYYP